jgi:amidophosphoribosyltransferase
MIQSNCGVMAIYSSRDCARDLWHGIFKLQHRGQRYCGIATRLKREIKISTHKGFVRHTFTPQELKELKGKLGIGHVSLRERQPLVLESRIGKFALAFEGNIINAEDLIGKLKSEGRSFSSNTQVELISRLIAQGENFVDGIEKMARAIKGSYSLVILSQEGIYVARDPYGFRPLILGKSEESFAAASESRAFQNLGMVIVRNVEPGEILLISSPQTFETKKKLKSKRTAYCAFEWGYVASMDSIIDGVPVVRARNNLGASLARRDKVKADLVAAVPFSGIGHALGYHKESSLPYDEVFLIDRFASRSYTPLTQKERDEEARIKLSVIEDTVKGKKIILCDDSIVRGTQIRNKVMELKKAGAKEVHVRVACPPLMAPCRYGISTRSYKELAAKKYSLEEIRKRIEADSLIYNTIEDFVQAIGLAENELCLSCWTEKHPYF